MNRYEKMQRLKDADFKQIIGVKRETFTAMNEVLIAEYERKHEKGGRKPKLTVEEQLIMTLKFIMVDGYGDPNTGAEYKTAVEILYGLSYSIKMSKKSGDRPDGYF
ncbi:MAG: hypothetical protein LBQ15_02730, partial [Clostridium sp.]|nr:hypothetical protein [Clostridium sp.]